MPYYTANEIVNMKLKADSIKLDSAVLNDLIQTDLKSKLKRNMIDGTNYFIGRHDYLDHKNMYYPDGVPTIDISRSNNLIPCPFHKLLVLQKRDKILGKPIAITVAEPDVLDPGKPTPKESAAQNIADEFQTVLLKELGERFDDMMSDALINTSNKAIEWLHFYIDRKGGFHYIISPAEEIIPIYDLQYQDNLIVILRYYTYEYINTEKDERELRYKVEYWTDKDVTYFEETGDHTFVLDGNYEINPFPHWLTYNTNKPDEKISHNWGRVPFVPIFNNSNMLTDLLAVKPLVDAFDKVYSGWCNDLEDFQELILILEGYNGLSTDASAKARAEGLVPTSLPTSGSPQPT